MDKVEDWHFLEIKMLGAELGLGCFFVHLLFTQMLNETDSGVICAVLLRLHMQVM
jgi:hypothetical protein